MHPYTYKLIHMYTCIYSYIYFYIYQYLWSLKKPSMLADTSARSKIHSQSATWRSVKLIMKHIVRAYTLGTWWVFCEPWFYTRHHLLSIMSSATAGAMEIKQRSLEAWLSSTCLKNKGPRYPVKTFLCYNLTQFYAEKNKKVLY